MARNFVGGNTNNQISAGAPATLANFFNGGGTIAVWTLTAGSVGGNPRYWDKWETGPGGNGPRLYSPSAFPNTIRLDILFSGGIGRWTTATPPFVSSVFQLILITYDSSSVANDPVIFVDGSSQPIVENNTPVGNAPDDTNTDLVLGNRGDIIDAFPGDLGEFAVWDTILPTQSIDALTNGVSPFVIERDNLLMHWRINGLQSTEPDDGPNQITGAVTGTSKSLTHPNVQLIEEYV